MPYKGKVFSQDRGNCKKVLKGEYIEQEFILKLAQIDPLNVEVILPVTFFPSIKVGMDAMVVPEAPLGGQYVAKIKIVDSVIDAASGTFGVRLELPNPGNRLPAGLKCKVILEHSGS
jgi:membrane fusion protein (multidrug efflux system)